MRARGSWFNLFTWCVWILYDGKFVVVVLFHSCLAFVEYFEVM